MRTQLYNAITAAVAAITDDDGCPVVRHIDLWNHNVEFIEQEDNWQRPAVFIEFHPIQWRQLKPGNQYHATAQFSLHVVTDWTGPTANGSPHRQESLEAFQLLDRIHAALHRLSGQNFSHTDLVESQTNHNHDELVENIETYQYKGWKTLSEK